MLERHVTITYKQSGVDIERGDALVDWLKASPQGPHHQKIVSGIGGFAALFKADFKSMSEPTLVSCTDGVGTKLKLITHFKSYHTVGQDLVGMNVNDLICCGAEPLFFLDYFATGHLELENAKSFLTGLRSACDQSDLALIGGETAEMPGFYPNGEFDCAGFAVGVVDLQKALGPKKVAAGAKILGISSSGFHSNGYSLIRKVFENDLDQHREMLLEPTALYVQVAKLLKSKCVVQAFAHITGGGIHNLMRVIPDHLGVALQSWQVPEAFEMVKQRAGLSWAEMLKTLNCGIGFVVIVDPKDFAIAQTCVTECGFQPFDLGEVTQAQGFKISGFYD